MKIYLFLGCTKPASTCCRANRSALQRHLSLIRNTVRLVRIFPTIKLNSPLVLNLNTKSEIPIPISVGTLGTGNQVGISTNALTGARL